MLLETRKLACLFKICFGNFLSLEPSVSQPSLSVSPLEAL